MVQGPADGCAGSLVTEGGRERERDWKQQGRTIGRPGTEEGGEAEGRSGRGREGGSQGMQGEGGRERRRERGRV